MRKLLALVIALSASPLAAQQSVLVRSGEHDGFSRLVLKIDPASDWNVVETPGEAVLELPDQQLNFQTRQVFDRIPKTRILDVSGTTSDAGSSLQLTLNCKCEVQSFVFNKNYIVLDVHDGPPLDEVYTQTSARIAQPDSLPYIQPSNAPAVFTSYVMAEAPKQPQLLPDPPPEEEPAPAPQLAVPTLPDVTIETGAEPMTSESAETPVTAENGPEGGVVSEMETMAGSAVSSMNEQVDSEDNPELRARIEEAQAQLLAQLTRAADQGLVDFVPAPVTPVADSAEAERPPEPAPEPEPDTQVIDPKLAQQLSARTAYATGSEDALTDIVNQFAMPQCQKDSYFLMDGWGGDKGFSEVLADLRSRLLGEFDAVNPEIAEQLVHLYLRYGLGAEARLVMDETDAHLEKEPVYRDMAALLEGEPGLVSGPVTQGAGCGGAHEMWYLAAGLGDYQVIEPLAITDAFSTYPIEVRALIGPPLAQAFIDRGQVEAGHVVLEIVRRAESGVTTAQHMAEAEVLEAQGNFAGAAEVYRKLALENGDQAPEALMAYSRTMLASGEPLPDTLLIDLESAGFMNRQDKISDDLRLWEIRVRNAVEGAPSSLAQIRTTMEEKPQIKADLLSITADIFEHTEAASLGDYTYAETVLNFADMLDQGEAGDKARLKIAEEMTSIGLPETALDVLAPNLLRPSQPVLLTQASAFVQLFQPQQAIDILAGDTSLEAYKIRLNAYLQMEDFPMVASLLNDPHAKEISVNDVALRAGDWAKIQDAGAVGTLASYVQGGADAVAETPTEILPPMAAPETPSLKGARDLLRENQESMQFLESVLNEGH